MMIAAGLLSTFAAAQGSDTTWKSMMELDRPGPACVLKGIELGPLHSIDLALEPFTVMADDAKIIVQGADGERLLDHDQLVHTYRGTVVGEQGTRAFVSVTEEKINGFISREDGLYWMTTDRADPADELKLHVMHARDVPAWNRPGVDFCGVVDGAIDQKKMLGLGADRSGASCVVVEIAYDSDYEYTRDFFSGDATASSAYMVTLGSAVSTIFDDQLGVKLVINYTRVWEVNEDPYDPTGDDMLYQFQNHWNNNMGFVDRDVAHILSGRDNLPYGGVAFGSTLCNGNAAYSVSGYLNGSFPSPLEDNNGGNWDLIVQAHELGHNFGASHTHDIGIDNCAGGDCDDAFGATIMSYCHLCPGGVGNQVLEFHPQIKNQMNSLLGAVSCDEPGLPSDAIDDNIFTGVNQPIDCDVLLNDIGASCDPSLVDISSFEETTPNGGTITLVPASPFSPRDQLRYTPSLGFSSIDTFGYELASGQSATVIVAVGSSEDVLFVPAQYPTIQLAIDAARDGDEIIVAPGVYTDDGDSIAKFNGKQIYLHSSDGPEFTILDGERQRPVIELIFSEDETTVVEGFTIIRGYSTIGGGLRIDGTPRIIDCIVRDNDAQGLAGGMVTSDLVGPELYNVRFCHNILGTSISAHTFGNWVNVDGGTTEDDWCECPGDADRSGAVTIDDLLTVLLGWGSDCLGCDEDLYVDGRIGIEDLLQVLSAWDQPCP